ncbi:hypothetical protein WA026_023520 [Henosepilachna vigintioctopunctata]|uniref:Uncharacterized protein n=1 Tax=Henosepilachna vigintioctopunctata TaxID=420089 RepID=A0AAW1TQ42_9CUCU
MNIFQKAQHNNVATFRKIIFADNNISALMNFVSTDLCVLIKRMNAKGLKFGSWQIQCLMYKDNIKQGWSGSSRLYRPGISKKN